MDSKNIKIFPGLNTLRAIAAYSVLIQHCLGIIMIYYQVTIFKTFHLFILSGRDAVTLFFVLSGFLITYLLLQKQDNEGEINFFAFYRRRILRIFPLYYLTVILSFLVLTFFHSYILEGLQPKSPWLVYSLLIFFLPNIALLLDFPVLGAAHLWSLGVENQFYLIWPLLLKKCRLHIKEMIISVILFKWFVRLLIIPYILADTQSHLLLCVVGFFKTFSIESMALGGLGAWLVFTDKRALLKIIYHPIIQLSAIAVIVWDMIHNFDIVPVFVYTILIPISCSIVVLNVGCNPRTMFKLEHPIMDFLGNISYAVYMFHPVVIFACVVFANKYYPNPNFWVFLSIYFCSILITTVCSSLCYRYFESYFLSFKSNKSVKQVFRGDSLPAVS